MTVVQLLECRADKLEIRGLKLESGYLNSIKLDDLALHYRD